MQGNHRDPWRSSMRKPGVVGVLAAGLAALLVAAAVGGCSRRNTQVNNAPTVAPSANAPAEAEPRETGRAPSANAPAANAPAANAPGATSPGSAEPGATTPGSGPASNAPAASAPIAAVSGQQVFTQNCVRCHGVQGDAVPGWRNSVQKMTLAQVEKTVQQGKDGMPSFAQTLSPAEIQAVSSYAKELAQGTAPTGSASSSRAAAGGAVGTAATSDASTTGAAVFNNNCASCHGKSGDQVAGWKASVRSMSLSQVEQVIRKGKDGMPAFAGKLSSAQIAAAAKHAKQLAAK